MASSCSNMEWILIHLCNTRNALMILFKWGQYIYNDPRNVGWCQGTLLLLWQSGAIWQHGSGSILIQIIARYLTIPSNNYLMSKRSLGVTMVNFFLKIVIAIESIVSKMFNVVFKSHRIETLCSGLNVLIMWYIKNNARLCTSYCELWFLVTSEVICQWFSWVMKSRVKIIGKSPQEWQKNRYPR